MPRITGGPDGPSGRQPETGFGIVLGRFQPVHLGHVEYLQAAKDRCRRLVIGITNPDLRVLDTNPEDVRRSMRENNPYTYYERLGMLEGACTDLGWGGDDFLIVPAPITRPESLPQFLPPPGESVCYVTIYDEWGEAKKARLEALGYPVVVLWRRSMADRLTTGTYVRECVRTGNSHWESLVPEPVVPIAGRLNPASAGDPTEV